MRKSSLKIRKSSQIQKGLVTDPNPVSPKSSLQPAPGEELGDASCCF